MTHDQVDERSVRQFLAFDADNPTSIRRLHRGRARQRALGAHRADRRAVGGDQRRLERAAAVRTGPHDREAFTRFLDWVKAVSLAFDGAAHRTMLRNDGYWFLRLGAEIERADNTARLLDVKYHLLLPEGEKVGGGLDYFQWTTLLREVSALTAYRWVYRESVKPWLVADLLILNRQMPRSLASCQRDDRRAPRRASPTAYGRRGPEPAAGRRDAERADRAPASTTSSSRACTSSSPTSSATTTGWARAISDQYLV